MNALVKKHAISIMDKLMIRPCSSVFSSIILPPISKMQNTSYSIQSNLSLSIIKQRILDNYYPRVQMWQDDMEQLWSGVELQPGIDNSVLALVERSRDFYLKEKRKIDTLTEANWTDELGRIRTKISVYMSLPPPKIKQAAANLGNSLIPKPEVPVLSDAELKAFVEATNMMDTEADNQEINRILTEMQPGIVIPENSSAMINVTALSIQTINAIKTYMKVRLEKRGLKYPSET